MKGKQLSMNGMREKIYTIPITEVFEPRCGCPLCRLDDVLEEKAIDYIMGSAMMEPDVRIKTNEQGFCEKHMGIMLPTKNKLSIALMLETRLDELSSKYIDEKNFDKKGRKYKVSPSTTCFVCSEIEEASNMIIKNCITRYVQDKGFAKLYLEQPGFCIKHYEKLCSFAYSQIGKKNAIEFIKATTVIAKKYISEIRDDVHEFVMAYDYRSAGKAITPKIAGSVEVAAKYCTGLGY